MIASRLRQAIFQHQNTPSEKRTFAGGGLGVASSLGGVSKPNAKAKPPVARARLALVGVAALVLVGAVAAGVDYWPGGGSGSAELTTSTSVSEVTSPPVPTRDEVDSPLSASSRAEPSPSDPRCPPGMAFIAAGKFRMGSGKNDKDADTDERPAHDVTLTKPFCLDVAEVTVAKYRACTKEARNGVKCARAPTFLGSCNGDSSDRDEHPINCVDWKMADTYCKWAGGALPTEAQWEYAARGREGRKYPWGNEPPPGPELLKWNSSVGTAPVKSYPNGKTPEGVFDLAGNVWEWVADVYAPYGAAPSTDPLQIKGTWRALHGGGWNSDEPRGVRAAHRVGIDEGIHNISVGFRCARGPNQ